MSQPSDQTDLQTHAYAMTPTPSTPTSTKTGPSATQKKLLGISAATLLLGGAAWAWPYGKTPPVHGPGDKPSKPDTIKLPDDIDVAGKVTDTMTFEQAYGAAREEVGMGGVFSWHGRWYNTFEKEEWGSLSLEQRQEFTEMITQEHLPVKPYRTPNTHAHTHPVSAVEPTIIEGHLNGQRVMGLDFDQDGVIDTLVMEGEDGYTYRVVDAVGNDGLDTLLRYDSLTGELVEMEKIDEPFVLTNDHFSQGLEASMSKEVVDSILEPELAAPSQEETPDEDDDTDDNGNAGSEPEPDDNQYLADSHEPDDTYINDGDVHDMDE